jgi:hypothetical protein
MATQTMDYLDVENGSYLFGHPSQEQVLGGPILRVTHEPQKQTRPIYQDSMQRQTEAHARDFNTELGITQLKALLGM